MPCLYPAARSEFFQKFTTVERSSHGTFHILFLLTDLVQQQIVAAPFATQFSSSQAAIGVSEESARPVQVVEEGVFRQTHFHRIINVLLRHDSESDLRKVQSRCAAPPHLTETDEEGGQLDPLVTTCVLVGLGGSCVCKNFKRFQPKDSKKFLPSNKNKRSNINEPAATKKQYLSPPLPARFKTHCLRYQAAFDFGLPTGVKQRDLKPADN